MRWLLPILALVLNACGGSGIQRRDDPDAIIRLTEADARGLDPQMVSDLASTRIAADLFEGLTRFDAQGKPEAGMAESWTTSADGSSW
jgi:oligopeptide transport system substrate-binding protein